MGYFWVFSSAGISQIFESKEVNLNIVIIDQL